MKSSYADIDGNSYGISLLKTTVGNMLENINVINYFLKCKAFFSFDFKRIACIG